MTKPTGRSSLRGLFVTGTDTGVGKTLTACALLRAFTAMGARAVGMKPVAAGAERRGTGLFNEDAERLAAAGNVTVERDCLNPYCLEEAVAPHIAARVAGIHIDMEALVHAYAVLSRRADVVVVEGAGGFRVPLNDEEDTGDLAVRLDLPVVLVVGMRLGCINHALLTAEAIDARRLRLAGWVANHIDSEMPRAEDNVAALTRRLAAPCIARIPWLDLPDAQCVARLIDVEKLICLQ